MPVSVAIVEDDTDIRNWLHEIISVDDGLICHSVNTSATEFITVFPQLKVDVVLMDINMPGVNGIECVAKLKPLKPEVQFMMCTVFEDSENVFASLCAGATGYLLKNTSAEKVRNAIKELNAGGSPMSAQIARMVASSFQQKVKAGEGTISKLSGREKEIIDYLAKGYRYKEIGDKLFISTETVRTHIRNIYEKLQVQSRTEALNKLFPR